MTQPTHSLEYRKDVDGLRAIAVMLVILFHTEAFGLHGGYIGVDVFFVISGYLITQRILSGSRKGKFTFKEFYVRRIRRLFPAMMSTVAMTVIAGYFFLSPDHLERLAISAVTSILSVANVQYFLEAGYWDASSWTKPLLHMWSLSVEEQFYIIWPTIIILMAKWSDRLLLGALVVISLISIAVTTWATGSDAAMAFYLTPFRIYEFAIGGACVLLDRIDWRKNGLTIGLRELASVAGIAIVIATAVLFNEDTAFPGWIAVIPAIGTALVICANGSVISNVLLANPVSRFVGLTSYSLYLIHWPVLVYARNRMGELDMTMAAVAVAITFAIATAQYYLIEQPFRKPMGKVKTRFSEDGVFARTVMFACLSALIIALSSIAITYNRGYPGRYGEEMQQFAEMEPWMVARPRLEAVRDLCRGSEFEQLCGSVQPGPRDVLIIGDSHGPDGFNILSAAFPNFNFIVGEEGGCPPIFNLDGVMHGDDNCPAINEVRFAEIESIIGDIDYVVFSMRIDTARVAPLQETIDWFVERGKTVIVLGAGPQFDDPLVPMIVSRGMLNGIDRAMARRAETEHYAADDVLEPYVTDRGGVYVRKTPFFCPELGPCRVLTADGYPIMYDQHHLSLPAAQAFGMYIRDTYPRLLRNGPATGE